MRRIFLVSIILAAFFCLASGAGSIREMTVADWTNALSGLGINPEKSLVGRLSSSAGTLDAINSQKTKELSVEEWIAIFRQLNLEPKPGMQSSDWERFFTVIGLNAAGLPETRAVSAETVPVSQAITPPAPAVPAETASAQAQSRPAQTAPRDEYSKTGDTSRASRISLDLKGVDIISVLKMISQKTDLNIIAGSSVKGSVNIYLKNIDALDALKMILEMNDLAYTQEGRAIKVITSQDYERIYGKKFYDPTEVEIVKLNHATVEGAMKTISSVKSKIAQVIPDDASNSLIIMDTRENIDDLKKIIRTIDRRDKEVLIEARIVQVLHDDSYQIGVNWETVFGKIQNQNMPGVTVGNLGNITRINPIQLGDNGVQLSVGTLNINDFNAVYDMLQTVGKTNLVASPRIATMDNTEARILVGTKEAYVTTQVTNPGVGAVSPIVAESVSFIDVGTKLYVTPRIGEDDFITMKIRPEVSAVDRILRTSENNPIPIIRTSEAETTVMVKDGVTIIIAGLIDEKEMKKTEGIPILCRIPLLGMLFSRTAVEKVKSELVVFLTPHIMMGDMAKEELSKDVKKILDKEAKE
jgi:type IV pilus assembly protein PilQ